MEHEFGSGLRAHLSRHVAVPAPAPAAEPAERPEEAAPPHALETAAPPRHESPSSPDRAAGPSLDERIERLSAAEAELSFRERRVGEREMSFNVAVQRVVYRLAQDLLEGVAARHDGVEKVYALQAGREIRVIVKPKEVDDDAAVLLSHEIAREIEDQLEYPGQIKVTVIRESRAIEFAK